MGSIYDRSVDRPGDEPDRFTVGFTYNDREGLEFDELKTYANKQASDRLKNLMIDFLTKKDISFKLIKDLRVKDSSSGLIK
jgi:uncharacterized Zn ribbon protein